VRLAQILEVLRRLARPAPAPGRGPVAM
jgi:hypothetical protein